ncbi:MAG: hypothetical protein ABIH26_10185 [Candidatus Eisenbacteria bacterium]
MRKLILLAAVVAMMSTAANAMEPGSIALGWVKNEAPIGIRYVLAEKIAADVGVGFFSKDMAAENADYTNIYAHIGLPIELLAGDRASLAFRPGFTLKYTTFENEDIDATTDFWVHAWLAVYYAATESFGVTAAHGLDIQILDGGAGDNLMDIYSIGANAFEVGWYYWF